jgi:putative redox protein
MSFTASARRVGDGLRHEVDVNGRHTIVTDEPEHLGGTDTGPAPHELLPAMLAACVSTTVAMYAARKDWDVGGLGVDVEYDNDAEPRRLEVTLRLPGGLTADQVKRLERVVRSCPVSRALEAGFAFEQHTVLAEAALT